MEEELTRVRAQIRRLEDLQGLRDLTADETRLLANYVAERTRLAENQAKAGNSLECCILCVLYDW